MDSIYSGLSSFGRIFTDIKTLFAVIFGLGLIAYGFYVLYVRWDYLEDPKATVQQDSTCTKLGNQTTCSTVIDFTDKQGKKYTKTFESSSAFKKGDVVTVFYKASDPSGTAMFNVLPKTMGYLLIGGGVLFILASIGWMWLVNTYKPLAAFAGVGDVIQLARAL